MQTEISFCQQHKYQDNERVIYQKITDWRPKTIVELGYGSGALTVAMAYGLNGDGIIHSYDINDPTLLHSRLKERNLSHLSRDTQGNVFDTFLKQPFSFDVLILDIDNTWELIYNIAVTNSFINNQIKSGSKVVIEGGAPAHPRINHSTLKSFHDQLGEEIFSFDHISGQRTSLSILHLLK